MTKGFRITIRNGWNGEEKVLNSDIFPNYRLVSAVLSKSTTTYDSFTFDIDPTHAMYTEIEPYTCFVKVTRPDKGLTLFEGRVLTYSDSMDSSGTVQKEAICEGLEGFLHDSVQPWKEFHNTTPKDFLQELITEHNRQVESYKQITLGTVTVTNSTDNVYRFTDDTQDTWANIQDKLVSRLGGEMRIRNEGGKLFLDYEPEISSECTQRIELSHNMVSSSRNVDPTEIVTVLKPLGATQERQNSDGSTDVSSPHLTIASVNSGSDYLRDEALINQFGIHVKTETWEDVTTPQALLAKGRAFLNAQKAIKYQLQAGYIDLSFLEETIGMIECGTYVRIVNQLEGLYATERIVAMSLDLLDVANSTLTLSDNPIDLYTYRSQKRSETDAQKALINRLMSRQTKANKEIEDLTKQNQQLYDSYSKLSSDYAKLSERVKQLENSGGNTPAWTSGSKFIDLSSNNGSQNQAWYDSLYQSGVKGLMIKLTEGAAAGSAYLNPLFDEQKSRGITAKMKFIGAYHYFLAVSVSDAQAEAQWFLSKLRAKGIPTSAVVSCDVEDGSLTKDKAALTAEVDAFYKVLTDAGYTNTCDYSSASWFSSRFDSHAKYKWVASWGASSKPAIADAWQYTDKYNGASLDCSYSYNQIFV